MKKNVVPWLSIAVMLCAAVGLFAYQATHLVSASGKAATNTLTMPQNFSNIVLTVAPADSPKFTTGQLVTVAQFGEMMAQTGQQADFQTLGQLFKKQGWAWTAQTQIKVGLLRYQASGSDRSLPAPEHWDWQSALQRTASLCMSCIPEGPGEWGNARMCDEPCT